MVRIVTARGLEGELLGFLVVVALPDGLEAFWPCRTMVEAFKVLDMERMLCVSR